MSLKRASSAVPPPPEVRAAIERRAPGFWRAFGLAADRALAGVDGTITSWFRSVERNRAVGGQLNSQHLWGCAFDIVIPDPAQRTRAMAALRRETFFVIPESDHLHVQAFPSGTLRRTA